MVYWYGVWMSNGYTQYFLILDKLQVSRNNSVSTNNGHIYVRIFLRKPVYFNYEIEFIDMDNKVLAIDTMEGNKGVTTLSHLLIVTKDSAVMACFKVGGVRDPNSNAVAVKVQHPDMLIISHTAKS